MTTVSGRVAWEPLREFDLAMSGGARSFFTDGDPARTLRARAARRVRRRRGPTRSATSRRATVSRTPRFARAACSSGATAVTVKGGDIYGEQRFLGGRWMTSARLSLFDWQDDLRADRGATSFAYVLGGGFGRAVCSRRFSSGNTT